MSPSNYEYGKEYHRAAKKASTGKQNAEAASIFAERSSGHF
jgi:hypothetical protein